MEIAAIGCDGLIHTECEPPSSLSMGSNTALRGTFSTAVDNLLDDLQTYHSRARNAYRFSYCSLKDNQYEPGACDSAMTDDGEPPFYTNVQREPLRLLRLPLPAPPPKLHYRTWWRSISRKLMNQRNELQI